MKNKLSGFSLMEMLLVLLIIAIVMAASAPMVNRKMLSTMAEKSPWVWTDTTGSIAYNLNGNDNQTTTIGAMALPIGSEKISARLYISNNGTADGEVNGTNNSTKIPQIALGGAVNNEADPLFYIHKYRTSLAISSNKVYKPNSSSSSGGTPGTPGNPNQYLEGAISIGNKAEVTANNSIAIGNKAEVQADNSIAIGRNAFTHNTNALAIGTNAKTKTKTKTGTDVSGQGTAIGADTIASGDGSAALGRYAQATADGAVALGGWTKTTTNNVDSQVTAGAQASGEHSIAIGTGAFTQNLGGVVIGAKATTKLSDSVSGQGTAIGADTIASGDGSAALGRYAKATADGAVALGGWTKETIDNVDSQLTAGAQASAGNSIAIGTGAVASGLNSVAIGTGAQALARNSVAIGKGVVSAGNNAIAIGKTGTTVCVHTLQYESLSQVSDRRLKNVGEVFTGGLEQIKKLEVFNYTFKKDTEKTPRVGVMAQDLQKIFPNAVFKGEDGFLRIRMEDMFYALVNAVKELDAKVQMIVDKNIAGLKKQIADLEEENRVITEKNVALEKQIASLYEQNAKLEERMNAIEKQLAIKKNK